MIPEEVRSSGRLTLYYVQDRYPDMSISDPVTPSQYQEALELAVSVVEWAESIVISPPVEGSGEEETATDQ